MAHDCGSTHIIHNKTGVIPKRNTHKKYTYAYIRICMVYSKCICRISKHLCHLIIFPVFLHLTNPSHGPSASLCTKAWPSAPGYPIPGVTTEKLDVFLRFFSKDHGTRFYSNVNLARGIVPYKCGSNAFTKLVHLLLFLNPSWNNMDEYAIFHSKLNMCQSPKDMQIGAIQVLMCL